jgi:adenosine deaminase
VRLGVARRLADHPLPELLRHGVPVTLNADDPLLLTTTLTDEYMQVGWTFGLTDRHLADLATTSLIAADMTETTRTQSRTAVRQWLAAA